MLSLCLLSPSTKPYQANRIRDKANQSPFFKIDNRRRKSFPSFLSFFPSLSLRHTTISFLITSNQFLCNLNMTSLVLRSISSSFLFSLILFRLRRKTKKNKKCNKLLEHLSMDYFFCVLSFVSVNVHYR
jgi:hypothetical protein